MNRGQRGPAPWPSLSSAHSFLCPGGRDGSAFLCLSFSWLRLGGTGQASFSWAPTPQGPEPWPWCSQSRLRNDRGPCQTASGSGNYVRGHFTLLLPHRKQDTRRLKGTRASADAGQQVLSAGDRTPDTTSNTGAAHGPGAQGPGSPARLLCCQLGHGGAVPCLTKATLGSCFEPASEAATFGGPGGFGDGVLPWLPEPAWMHKLPALGPRAPGTGFSHVTRTCDSLTFNREATSIHLPLHFLFYFSSFKSKNVQKDDAPSGPHCSHPAL